MLDYKKLKWHSNFMASEIIEDYQNDFTVGIYSLIDFPNVTFYINVDENEIVEVFLEK